MMSCSRLTLKLWLGLGWVVMLNLTTACVYSADNEVSLNSTVAQDKNYAAVLKKASRSADVINNFEMRYKLKATALNSDFRGAFAKRFAEVYRQQGPAFEEADAKTGFFVSITSPDHRSVDITNGNHWNIFLTTKDGDIKPVVIKRLNDKLRWTPFFDYVDAWSQEYLVVFDSTTTGNSAELAEKSTLSLTFANADAHVSLVW